jgi:hypothetical protein
MNIMKKTLLASAVSAAAILTASAAGAANYNVTNVGFDGGTVTLSGLVNETANSGLITLSYSTPGGGTAILPTFCVDLFHTINIGGSYTYTTAPLLYDSNGPIPGLSGASLSTTQIGEIGALADVGVQEYKNGSGTTAGYTALQGAIWQIEYGTALTVNGGTDPAILADIAYAAANPYYGVWSVIPGVNGQNPFDGVTYVGQGLVTAPGPHLGEGLLGFAAMTALLIGARYRGLFV